jgi:hypothetical protein
MTRGGHIPVIKTQESTEGEYLERLSLLLCNGPEERHFVFRSEAQGREKITTGKGSFMWRVGNLLLASLPEDDLLQLGMKVTMP